MNLRIIFCNSVLPDQKKTTFYLVSRYEQWDGLPVQTRNSNHGPDKIQDHSSSSSNTQGTEEKKKTAKEKRIRKKKDLSIPPKNYYLGSISSTSPHVSFSAVSCRVFLTA